MYKSWYIEKAHQRQTKEGVVERVNNMLEKQELTTDTYDFLESIIEYYNKYKGLTPKQFKVLGEIEESLTPAGLANIKAWKDSYDENKFQTAVICAHYYSHTKYFTDVSKKILKDNSYILSEKTYKSMCENKYAKKVLRETHAKPKYLTGTLVKFRKAHEESIGICTVIDTDTAYVTSAAKGAKKYLVLPFGYSKPVEVEERHIKKYRKKMETI